MRRLAIALAVVAAFAPLHATDSAADVLAANRLASGGDAWNNKATLQSDYAYVGQGLTGSASSLQDLRSGAFVDSYQTGPVSGANGHDGKQAWVREPSGTVAWQGGGDTRQLAVNESYRDRNLWWRADRGGARISAPQARHVGQRDYEVLTVTPPGGKPFEAWFDARTHLLARTVEQQVTLTVTTDYQDYAAVDGVQLAHQWVVDDGSGAANQQRYTLRSARFLPPRDAAAYAKPKVELHDYSLAGGAHETTVPFQLINNHIYAPVSINGSKPLNFIFDTGGHDILTPATAKLLGIKAVGSQTATGDGDKTAQSGLARVETIRVGAATLSRQPVTVLQFSTASEGVDEQGMIGYEFFARFVTRIDYGKHLLTFIDKRYFDPKDAGTPVHFRFFGQFPEVLGSYDGIAGRFGIDTGARDTLSLTRPFATQNHLREREPHGIEALTGWGVGGPSHGYVFHGKELVLDGVKIASPLTEFSIDKGGAGGVDAFPNNVGGGLLKRFVVTLDYAHQLIYLKPIEGKVADLDTFDRSGMWINQSAQGFQIVDISKGTPADLAGLHVGDVITAVDNTPVQSLRLYELRERLRNDPPGTTVTLAIRRAGVAKTVKLILRDLI
ncbi:MAG TPA: aspartyl protease family protein [Dyella sp.]|uniref:aspartyl protease family protein n=1 Tax=Dyella sp. TaxID=1869338 RepID=UPI002C4D9883|nr:aspartyl protease family protein [Dyella sp.]HUB89731.1 aspartyl protease family protein [Dyella sp.]